MFAGLERRQYVMSGPGTIAPASSKWVRHLVCGEECDAVIEASRKAERRRHERKRACRLRCLMSLEAQCATALEKCSKAKERVLKLPTILKSIDQH